MKFKFRLEKVMRHRKNIVDIAQKDYWTAQSQVRQQLEKIDGLYKQSDLARVSAGQISSQGGTCAQQLQQLDEFINNQKIKIHRERDVARQLMSVAEEKQEILIDKTKDLKTLEKLKERHLAEFKKEVKILENKQLDDIVVMRAGKRRTV